MVLLLMSSEAMIPDQYDPHVAAPVQLIPHRIKYI